MPLCLCVYLKYSLQKLICLWFPFGGLLCRTSSVGTLLPSPKWVKLYKVQKVGLSWAPMDRKPLSHEKNTSLVLVTPSAADCWAVGFQNQCLAAVVVQRHVTGWVKLSKSGFNLHCKKKIKISACLQTISRMLQQKQIGFKKLSMTQIQNPNAGLIPENWI